jgi:glucose-1-phosphate adenylyltransferase
VVRDSVIFEDSVIEEGAVVDLAICDKEVRVGKNAVIGQGGNPKTPNANHPKHLYTGITLIGKQAVVPGGVGIGRNCIVNPGCSAEDFAGRSLADGESL